ncbi:MAG: Os1348 family NHLP clan protein [Candidatus Binatia bacterium]
MSQQWVETVLGRLITDAVFRERFFVEPMFVCRDYACDLTPIELSALLQLDPRGLQALSADLDRRIVRAVMGNSGRRHSRARRTSVQRRRQR